MTFMKLITIFILQFFVFFNPIYSENIAASNENEALFLRRIAEFWHDNEYEMVKAQINDFIVKYPNSTLKDSLYAILGNVFLNEKNYSQAVEAYDNIGNEQIKKNVAINLLGSLFYLKWYNRLHEESNKYINDFDNFKKDKIIYLKALAYFNEAKENNDEHFDSNLESAKEYFSSLLNSKYEIYAREYICEIHSLKNEYETASREYFNLSEKFIDRREEFLFQAALLEAHFNKEKAIETFSMITNASSNKTSEAAFNKILLLYELNRFQEIITQKDQLLSYLFSDKINAANYFIARSYYNLNDYNNASLIFRILINSESLEQSEEKAAFSMLLSSAYNLNDQVLYNETFNMFSLKYPEDAINKNNLFAKALLNKKNKNFEEAKSDFSKILNNADPDILFVYANLLLEMKDLEGSRKVFQELIANNNNPTILKNALKSIVNISIAELEITNIDDTRHKIIEDINKLLASSSSFSNKEKNEYKAILSKTFFDLKDYSKTKIYIEEIFSDSLESEILNNNPEYISLKDYANLNILLGFSYNYIDKDIDKFILFCEKGLEFNTEIDNKFIVYINLFNNYLLLTKEDSAFVNKAAVYLHKAFEIDPEKISKNNLIWLSDYNMIFIKSFFDNYNNRLEENTFIKNSLIETLILNKYLTSKDNDIRFNLNTAYIYEKLNNFEQSKEVLIELLSKIIQDPEKNSKFYSETVYSLAKLIENTETFNSALDLYNEHISLLNKDDKFALKATLHYIRLKLKTLTEDEKVSSNKEFENLLTILKNLTIKKVLENEPTHLEASLDYIDLLVNQDPSKKYEKKIFLLSRTLENFTAKDDIYSKDYQSMKNVLKDKDLLVNSYLKLIEAEKWIAMGFIEKNVTYIQKAKDIFTNLIIEKLITTQYLQIRMEKNLKEIEEFIFE
ncbi:MAG: hypothetical protein A2888_00730 [Chlamydiae bacterium RIFCSPLOWO2_01_FULL_28_7]|nr:MAG: hypothetical protein A2888_00730 [Chlamydiae bacterium RIFCSPLOWO2_01_FULL_28_7]